LAAYVEDTIAALATPPGVGAIAVIRISGRGACEVAARVLRRRHSPGSLLGGAASHQARLGVLHPPGDPTPIDEVLALQMLAPKSFTGEDVVEIHCHGGRLVPDRALRAVLAAGARAARPGEFTERAFLNGRVDLCQAEAIADLIEATSDAGLASAWRQLDGALSRAVHALGESVLDARAQIEVYLDFPEDDLPPKVETGLRAALEETLRELDGLIRSYDRSRLGREGLRVVLLGKPNVGKSSLLNALLGRRRALVSSEAGTTRDYLEEPAAIGDLAALLYDTAGIRLADSEIERAGIERSRELARAGDVSVCVFDAAAPLDEGDAAVVGVAASSAAPIVLVRNKIDLPAAWSEGDLARLASSHPRLGDAPIMDVSATSGTGLGPLCDRISRLVRNGSEEAFAEPPLVTHARQQSALARAHGQVRDAVANLEGGAALELIASDLQAAARSLESVTGTADVEEVLDRVFSRFCIGK
jgi:tRNA modification GTPase